MREIPAREAAPGPFPEDLPAVLVERLALLGIGGLHAHQREALDLVRAGRDVIVATGTASGKTLVYNLAVAEAAIADPRATALYLFPTKALARDQLRQVRALRLPELRAAVFDGDTPKAERPLIRKNANLVLSNPDMLHVGLLADHARWADFLLRLRYVVVDEAHVARGVFGSHVAMVLRRLRRLAMHYGGDPRFVLASATIGNPAELAERLVGVPFAAVTEDASPRGEKVFALWNPPIVDEDTGVRRSALTQAAEIVAALARDGVKSIGFARSRRAAELLAEFVRREVPPELRDRVKAYRAGYLPEDRRELERRLAADELTAIASTNALELGIDIGSLDAAVLVGYPGTRASMWQQAGRAGRRGTGSLAVLVAQDDPLDQYLVHHPDELLARPPEAAVIDPANPFVLGPHLRCAARELPLGDDELGFFGDGAAQVVADLVAEGVLARRRDRWVERGTASPHDEVDLRSTGGDPYAIVVGDTGELLGTVDRGRAFHQVHPGAVYLHQGEQFEVQELDLVHRVAVVERSDPDFYTQARDLTDIEILAADEEVRSGEVVATFGRVRVRNQVNGYARRLVATGETLEVVPLALPPQDLETRAIWWTIPDAVVARAAIRTADLPGAAHAAEHAAIGLLQLVATCDRWDVGGVSTAFHPGVGACAIFVYDAMPGGAGITERGFRSGARWLEATRATVAECTCSRGCPSCVQSPKCGNGNEPLDKAGAIALLSAMLGRAWG